MSISSKYLEKVEVLAHQPDLPLHVDGEQRRVLELLHTRAFLMQRQICDSDEAFILKSEICCENEQNST